MDLIGEPPLYDLNDLGWLIHTRSENRPPARIATGAVVNDSLITHGCTIAPGARIERSVLSAGVRVEPGAVVREFDALFAGQPKSCANQGATV